MFYVLSIIRNNHKRRVRRLTRRTLWPIYGTAPAVTETNHDIKIGTVPEVTELNHDIKVGTVPNVT